MNSPCDSCIERQKELDPKGCFRGWGSTGFFGRFLTLLIGCDGHRFRK